MFKRMRTRLFLVVVVATFASAGPVSASVCGFPGAIVSSTFGGGTGYVILYSIAPPFAFSGVGAAPLGTPAGDACMDLWRDSTLGPAPPNYNAVYAAAPPSCSSSFCSAPTAACAATICLTFP